MKNICLIAAASSISALKIKTTVENEDERYPGEPYRPPYLEKVTKDLNKNLHEQIPDSVPKEMNHLLCMFEEYEGTAEWNRLGCDEFLGNEPALPDLSCASDVAGRESCFTMQDAPGATIKWNGFSEIQDSTNPAKHI